MNNLTNPEEQIQFWRRLACSLYDHINYSYLTLTHNASDQEKVNLLKPVLFDEEYEQLETQLKNELRSKHLL